MRYWFWVVVFWFGWAGVASGVEHASVRSQNGVVTWMVDGQPMAARVFFSHWGNQGADHPALREQVILAKKAGVNIVSFMASCSLWHNPQGEYDWRRLDAMCDAILAANPDSLWIPRLQLYAPEWWLKQHPDARMVWKERSPMQDQAGRWNWESVASEDYRQAACQVLAAAITHLEEKYGSHILGYHPAGLNTDEWFLPNTWLQGYSGYGGDDLKAWRHWLAETYASDAALQAAWNDSSVTRETAEVPTPETRNAAAQQPIMGSEFQPVIDFHRFTQRTVSDTILALAKVVRNTTQGKKLVVFFYGYGFEFGPVLKGPAASGHYALRTVLDSPDVDVLCSPMSYFDRQPGGAGPCMTTVESIAAAGKLYMVEDDTRTFLAQNSRAPGWQEGGDSLEATLHLLRRNLGQCLVRNIGSWWMDLGANGWFNDAKLWAVHEELRSMAEYFEAHSTPYRPQVGLFLDEDSVFRLSGGEGPRRMLAGVRGPLNRLGAPYGQYLMTDLESGRIPPPKLCVMLNPQGIGAERVRSLEDRIRAAGSTPLWVDMAEPDGEMLRQLARQIGVHLYTDEPCNVWANGPYAVLHGALDGEVHVHLPASYTTLYDVLTGEELPTVFLLKKGETRIVHFRP